MSELRARVQRRLRGSRGLTLHSLLEPALENLPPFHTPSCVASVCFLRIRASYLARQVLVFADTRRVLGLGSASMSYCVV